MRIAGSWAIPTLLRKLGADPAEVIAEAGIDPALFSNPENRIHLALRSRLLRHCAARTGCAHFGLLVGQHNGLHALGLVGLLVKFSPDVGVALRSLVRYLHLHVRGAVTTLTTHGDTSVFTYEIHAAGSVSIEQTVDGAVATMFNIMRALCGPKWKPTEVQFSHRAPADVAAFRRFFEVRPRFDMEQNALVFASEWLRQRIPDADPDVRRLLQQQIDTLETRHGDDFPEQVRSVLRTALHTGHASADQVAALFTMHARTLNRRLTAFGTSFQKVADEVRFEIARQMLEDSTMPTNQIAAMLDYANASAFGRAFKRWSGDTPARWRATRGGSSS